jgi:ketosteroid isomerase-like protein
VHREPGISVHEDQEKGGTAMMEQEKNIQLVNDFFAALNRGDMQYILDIAADNIDWQSPVTGTIAEPISWAKPRRGKAELESFFKELFDKITLVEIKPLTFTAQDDRVFVEGTTKNIVKSNKQEYFVTWVMAITVRNGKCLRLRQYYDTADVLKAFPLEMRKAA